MNRSIYLLPILALVALASCTKVIDVKLNDANAKVVIEGKVTDQAGPQTVRLTKTINFNKKNEFPPVSGALVILRDLSSGAADTLDEVTPGNYQTNSIPGISNHVYSLQVTAEGKTYTATSTMPVLVPFDSLYYENFAAFGEISKNIIPLFQDPAGVKNFYRFVEYVNGKWEAQYPWDDRFTDGRYSDRPLFNESDDVKAGDSVRIEMQCIDEGAFRYFDSYQQATGSSDAPANPVTNISGGALGYFSAYTLRTKSIKVGN